MQLKPVATFDTIDPNVFKREFYEPGVPVVIKKLAHDWPAFNKWNWSYFKQLVGDKKVPLYNNVKSDAYTAVNSADDHKLFAEYIDEKPHQNKEIFWSLCLEKTGFTAPKHAILR